MATPAMKMVTRAVARQCPHTHASRRCFTTPTALPEQPPSKERIDIESLLSQPAWSISALLPPKDASPSTSTPQSITPTQLHHLLRLSALPPPSSPHQEQQMLQTLTSQLQFVRSIQSVDTTDVKALRSLRDETAEGEKEAEMGVEEMREALDAEEVRGKWHPRVRRKMVQGDAGRGGEWDVLGQAERKTGRYLVVEGGRKDG